MGNDMRFRTNQVQGFKAQRGSVLFVSLILLVAMTMIAVATTRVSSTQLTLIGNIQATQRVEAAAQLGVEEVIGRIDAFTSPTQAIAVANVPTGINLTVSNRQCLNTTPASGFSAVMQMAPEDTLWTFDVQAADSLTGATTTITQGVRVRMLAGSCV